MKPLIVFLFSALLLAAQSNPVWEHDLDSALRRAQAEHKQVFVDVWTEWCGPCQYLQKNIFPTPEASAALSKLVPASLMVQTKDRKDTPGGKAVMEKFGVKAFPTMLLLDAKGSELRRKVGTFKSGQELAAWISDGTIGPQVGPGEERPKASTPKLLTDVDRVREQGTKHYEAAMARIARGADQLDAAFTRFLQRHWDGQVRGHFDRPFYALWEDGGLEGKPYAGAESRLEELRRRAKELHDDMQQAEEQARRADVFPGDRRKLRAKYKLEHRGWD